MLLGVWGGRIHRCEIHVPWNMYYLEAGQSESMLSAMKYDEHANAPLGGVDPETSDPMDCLSLEKLQQSLRDRWRLSHGWAVQGCCTLVQLKPKYFSRTFRHVPLNSYY
jgi:hypothetical protein